MKRLATASFASAALLVLSACGSSQQAGGEQSSAALTLTDGMTAKVVSVESANTFTADFSGLKKQVRLINTAAPSVNGVAFSSNCLVDESKALLSEKLPVGTEVTLNFDESQRGNTGFVEAAVYVGESFINRDMARAGLVATTYATASDEFYPEISQAQQEAADEGIALYSMDVDCTIPAAIAKQKAQVEDARSWEVNTADDAPAEEKQKVADREAIYQQDSTLYQDLSDQTKAPSQWVGSIVTLSAVDRQLVELQELLGDDLYPREGLSVNQQKKAAESDPVRPGS